MSIWFITGSSRGFGRALTEAALAAGHDVVATARRPEQLAELAAAHPHHLLPLALDVTDVAQVDAALHDAVARFGRVDVVVNNAGYADLAPIETAAPESVRAQFETNFWGVYNVSRAVIPQLRAQGGGLIVQFSSIGGRVGGSPGLGSYQAAKFAVDGFTRVLSAETEPFGIRTLVVEPSGFATDWAGSSMAIGDIPADYDQTVGLRHRSMRASTAGAAGDPVRAAEIIVRVVDSGDAPSHLPIGGNAVTMAADYSTAQLAEVARWGAVGASADFAAEYPIDLPR